jgi:hypothetical protein
MVEQWGQVPLAYLAQFATCQYTYGYIGSDDLTMYPILPPGSFVQIDESKKKAVEGMDQEAVILALGRPLRKTRETKDDVEQETWQFGEPPGRVTFVTFAGSKVIHVRDTYAAMGGSVAQIPTPDR